MEIENTDIEYIYICMDCKKENKVKITSPIICYNCQFRIFLKPRSKTPVQLLAR